MSSTQNSPTCHPTLTDARSASLQSNFGPQQPSNAPPRRSTTVTWQQLQARPAAPRVYQCGRWKLHLDSLTLILAEGTRDEREVDLEAITSPAALSIAIFSIAGMNGVTADDASDLLRVLQALFNPLRHFRSDKKKVDPVALLRAAGYEVSGE